MGALIDQLRKPGWAILAGMIITILVSLVLKDPATALVVGVIISLYLARPSRVISGAEYGALIALPVGMWINLPTLFFTHTLPLEALLYNVILHILLIAVVGALYGAVYVWLTNWLTRGRRTKS